MKNFFLIGFGIGIIFLFFSCKDTVTGDDIDKRAIPDKDVSYTKHIQPVFDIKCNSSGCHNDEDRAGSISLTSYQNTTADLSVVFPGQPQNSRLATAIQPSTSIPMPPMAYPPLTENQVKGIITWIKEGANNN